MKSNNNRNLIIALVLSLLVVLGWEYFVAQPQIQKSRDQATTEETVAAAGQTEAPPSNAPASQIAAAAPSAPAAVVVAAATREEAIAQTARVPIVTPAFTGSINLSGARIDDLSLTGYHETVDPTSPNIVLLSPATGPAGYFAEFGWLNGGTPLVNSTTVWTAPAGATLTADTPVTLTYDNGAGLVIHRTISVDSQYLFTVSDTVDNAGAAAATLTPYARVARLGEPQSRGTFILHEGMIGYLEGQGLKEVKYSALEDDSQQKTQTYDPTTSGWVGITDKYWATALIPTPGQSFRSEFTRVTTGDKLFQADFSGNPVTVAAGGSTSYSTQLFAGAKEVKTVNAYAAAGIQRFDLMIDWGWFYFLTKPMFWLLDTLYNVVGNFGVAILLVTVLLKFVFFPLANRSYRSMAAMRKVGPQMQQIRERYKDDRAKQQQLTMELYKKEKINPIAGCWPVLVQVPVFFSLYKVLYGTIEMRHAPFFGWIKDLSAPDPTSIVNLFGLLPYDAPTFLAIGVWPILMGISMWMQMRLNPQQAGAPQIIFHILPIIFTFTLSSFPAGLVIYWTWNNTLSLTQQAIIMRRHGVKVDFLGNIRSSFRRKPKDAANANKAK